MTARPQIENACATAPGKVILLGEHAVVYGRRAIAAAIDRHVCVRIHGPCDSRESALRQPAHGPNSSTHVMPAKAGIQERGGVPAAGMDSRFRGHDDPCHWLMGAPARRQAGRVSQGERSKNHFEFEIEHPFVVGLAKPAAAAYRHPDPRLAEALARAADLVGLNGTRLAVSVSTNLPLAMGLGSSAALSVALVRALARFARRRLDAAAVCAAAFEIEKIFHGFPSGIDNTVATYGGLIAFERGAAVGALTAPRSIPLVAALGCTPRRTRKTVATLRHRWEASPTAYERLFDEIAVLVSAAERAIAAGCLATLGAAMNTNHGVLQRLGISTDELDAIVSLARTHGALGAKLTGGGGGGAVICLCDGTGAELVAAFRRAGWRAFATTIGATQRGAYAGDSPEYLDEHCVP
ncbi:MAG TPA: mevalonate kinase [Candidatus Margulisiibacteriota bacterium]|nr:mevalonate kinase [Candidatus Margulisiibacteriota bacterium]